MPIRSWLFVPGDSARKLARAPECGADIVIVDLEDAVAPDAKDTARIMARAWLAERAAEAGTEAGAGTRAGTGAHTKTDQGADGAPQYWVRINPLDTPLWRLDVEAVLAGKPAGIVVPKTENPAQLQRLSLLLDEYEPRSGIVPGATRLLPLVSETAQAANGIAAWGSMTGDMSRCSGLTWGAEDLSAAIGASRKRRADGSWTDLFRMVRAQTLLAAHAAGLAAIDTLHADFRDEAGLQRVASDAFADGFSGMMAIHPAQVPIINACFTPTAEQIAEAQAIVALFADNPGVGALQLDGRMIDRPHLAQAEKLLAGLGPV